MGQIHGKQIKAATVTEAQIDISGASAGSHPASRTYVGQQIDLAKAGYAARRPVRVAVGTNINLSSPGSSLDSLSMNSGDDFLAFAQTTGTQNGTYVWNGASSAATRRPDEDTTAEIVPSMILLAQEGTYADKMFRLTTNGPITLGTTSLTFTVDATLSGANPTQSNKWVACLATTADGDKACNTAMVSTPAAGSFASVLVNGVEYEVGDAVKTKDCYFSTDNGATALARNANLTGAYVHWNGSVALHQLATSDKMSINYNV